MGSRRVWFALAIGLTVTGTLLGACESTIRPPFGDNGEEGDGSTPFPPPGGEPDAAREGGEAGTASCFGEDAGCNSLTLCTGQITDFYAALPAPTAAGGVIAPGVYALTAESLYASSGATGSTGDWFEETFTISAAPSGISDAGNGDAESADAESADAGAEDGGSPAFSYPWQYASLSSQSSQINANGIFTVQGKSFSISFGCGGNNAPPYQGTYTSTPTSITLYVQDPGVGTEVLTYTTR